MKRIAILATLNTKGDEAQFLAECIQSRGHAPHLIDLSLISSGNVSADTTRESVAGAAGRSAEEVAQLQRAGAMEVMAAGAARLLDGMLQRGEVQGVIGIGGGTGTWMSTAAVRSLPIGFPKLVVSTLAGRDSSTDTTVMPSVADIAGLNKVLTPILANAAAAISGMVEGVGSVRRGRSDRPSVAMTMFGVTTRGGTFARQFLEDAGCEVVVFHATGAGGATMEDLIRRGTFVGVLDWTTTEVTDHLTGGVCDAGPNRLEAAGAVGLPQVIVPGAIDVINVGRGGIPTKWARRASHMHLPGVPLVRTSVRESREIGSWIAKKLSRASGLVRVLIPAGGYSALDVRDGPFWDPVADQAFVSALRKGLRPDIPIDIDPHHINDEAFARAAADAMLSLGVARGEPVLV
jgi:uncharacterized protein (UPF0261 family)